MESMPNPTADAHANPIETHPVTFSRKQHIAD